MEPKPIPRKALEALAPGTAMPTVFQGPPDSGIGDLEILIVEDLRAVLQGKPPISARWISWWQPSEEEVEQLKKGAPIRLEIIGATQINPMRIEVGSDID